jgi:hypothetical protein
MNEDGDISETRPSNKDDQQLRDDQQLKNAATIGTALMLINSHRALLLVYVPNLSKLAFLELDLALRC